MILRKMKINRASWGYSCKVEDDIRKYEKEYLDGEAMTKEEVLEHLFGTYIDRPTTKLDLYLLEPQTKSMRHRVNMLWSVPLTLILAPYSYVRYGSLGWTNKTFLGKFVLKCVGEDK